MTCLIYWFTGFRGEDFKTFFPIGSYVKTTVCPLKVAILDGGQGQASTLTFVRLSCTSENWRRTSRSCITGQVKKSDSQTCRYDGQIYFHWYKILGLLYKRALFDLQFVHNLFWLKLKWNARSKLFYLHSIYRYSMLWWSSRTMTKLKSQSQKRFKEQKYQ